MTLSVQFTVMAVMTLSGIYLGIALDTFRRFRIYWARKKWTSYFMEISFWLLQTLIVFYCLFLVNQGELRLYIILACLLGFSCYQALLRNIYLRILEWLITVFLAIYNFLKRVVIIFIILPIKWILTLCYRTLLFLFHIVVTLLTVLLKIILFPFLLIGQWLKPLVPKKLIKFYHKFRSIYSTIRNTLVKWFKSLTFKRR